MFARRNRQESQEGVADVRGSVVDAVRRREALPPGQQRLSLKPISFGGRRATSVKKSVLPADTRVVVDRVKERDARLRRFGGVDKKKIRATRLIAGAWRLSRALRLRRRQARKRLLARLLRRVGTEKQEGESTLSEQQREGLREVFYNVEKGYVVDAALLWSRLPAELRAVVTRKQVTSFIKSQRTVQLNQSKRVGRHTHGHIVARTPGDKIQADLLDMSPYISFEEKGDTNWILVCVDVYSRFMFAVPLRRKTKEDTAEGLRGILRAVNDNVEKLGYPPSKLLQTDRGKEFLNTEVSKELKKYPDLRLEVNELDDHSAQGIVERANANLRRRLQLLWVARKTRAWKKFLPAIVNNINASVHSAIGVKPVDVWEGRTLPIPHRHSNQEKTALRAYGQRRARELVLGARVRVYNPTASIFAKKAHELRYSEEVFVVANMGRVRVGAARASKVGIVELKTLQRLAAQGESSEEDPLAYMRWVRADRLQVVPDGSEVDTVPVEDVTREITSDVVRAVKKDQSNARKNRRAGVEEVNVVASKRIRVASRKYDNE